MFTQVDQDKFAVHPGILEMLSIYELTGIVLLFEKTSTRTRCSFEVAATQEGAHVTYLDAGSSQMGKKESLEDSAKVLGRFFDGIEYRGYEQSVVEDLAKWSGVPVWNGLTDADHPTQILADLMTIEEHYKKPLNKIKVVFPGDVRNNMCYAWMMGAAKLGMHFVAMGPEELAKQMDQEVVQSTFAEARKNGGLIEITDHAEDLKGADVIYGDVWASMGEEAQIPERVGLLSPFRVTMDTLKATENPDVLYLHCLPSFHDFETKMAKEWQAKGVDIREVTDEVFRSRHSVVFDEAENSAMHRMRNGPSCRAGRRCAGGYLQHADVPGVFLLNGQWRSARRAGWIPASSWEDGTLRGREPQPQRGDPRDPGRTENQRMLFTCTATASRSGRDAGVAVRSPVRAQPRDLLCQATMTG